MQTRKALGKRIGLGIDDEIDVALTVEGDVFVAVAGAAYSMNSKPSVPIGLSQVSNPILISFVCVLCLLL